MRSTIYGRAAGVAALACLVFLTLFASAASAAGLDRSYGVEGAVAVSPPKTLSNGVEFREFAVAPDGSVYGLARSTACGSIDCTTSSFLLRYTAAGSVDTGFASAGGLKLPPSAAGYALGVDSEDRALLAGVDRTAVTVRRYAPTGQLDRGFGDGGQVSIRCDCGQANPVEPETWVMPAGRGRTLVEVLSGNAGGTEAKSFGGTVILTRLRADGTPDRGFGGDGTTSVALGDREHPGRAAVTSKGAVVLGGSGCCNGSGTYLLRVSKRGRVDKKFGRVAQRSLWPLRQTGELAQYVALLPRSKGGLDVLGKDPVRGGFDFRLEADGSPARFGHAGLRKLPFRVQAAVAGSEGALFVVGSHTDVWSFPPLYFAYRVLGSGRLDPAFGTAGIRVPVNGLGVGLGRVGDGKALVTDLGELGCRQECPPTPGFARFVEGRARR